MMDLSDTGIRHRVNLILHRWYDAGPAVLEPTEFIALTDAIEGLACQIRDAQREASDTTWRWL